MSVIPILKIYLVYYITIKLSHPRYTAGIQHIEHSGVRMTYAHELCDKHNQRTNMLIPGENVPKLLEVLSSVIAVDPKPVRKVPDNVAC